MGRNSWKSSVEMLKYRRHYPRDERVSCTDPNLAYRRIGDELNVLYRLTQIVEHGGSAVEQGAAILRRLGAMTAAIKQPYGDHIFKISDRPRDSGLRGVQDLRRLAHAASLDNGHQHVKIVQFHTASDAITQQHLGHPLQYRYVIINK